MPWSYPNNLPPSVANKTEEQKKKFVEVANASLSKGRNQEEAMLAGMMAIKQHTVKKVNNQVKELPSHLRVVLEKPEIIKQVNIDADPEDRSLKSAKFDELNRLVITLQNNEKIITNPVESQLVESITSVSGVDSFFNLKDIDFSTVQDGYALVFSQMDNNFYFAPVSAGGQPSNIKHFDKLLTGTTLEITNQEHNINEIVSIYFIKNGKNVEVLWEFTSEKHILIESNVDLTGIQLIAHGK